MKNMEHLLTFLLLCLLLLPLPGAMTSLDHSIHRFKRMHVYQPSASLINLIGAHKGVRAPEIRDVKSYLHRFGYLNNNLKNDINRVVDDIFDDAIEHALLAYQEFFKLNKTGVLDNDTISMMSEFRCGSPDIHATLEKGNFHNHFVFYPNKPHRTADLYYGFRLDIPDRFKTAINQAFTNWQPYVPIKFINTDHTLHVPDVLVGFFRGNHGDGSPFDGKGKILAHASPGKGSIFHFDADEPWEVGAVPGGIDVTSVATHEIGHLLGLGHSDVKNAIMYPTFSAGTVKNIGNDDLAGIKELYYNS